MTTIQGAVEVLPSEHMYNYDHKQYRVIRLTNQMKVLLIHDKTIHDGQWFRGCGIAVDVGSLSDPPEIPGLAELVVEKIQSLNENLREFCWFSSTFEDGSVSSFSLRMDSVDEILAKLADMLRSPLKSDGDLSFVRDQFYGSSRGWYDLATRLISRTANIGHPARHDAYVCDDVNKMNRMNVQRLRRRMTEFVIRHYSAHRMYVCLNTSLPLDEMQDLAVKHFSSVPNNMLPGIDFTSFTHENAYQPRFHENVFFIKGPDAGPVITLTWCLPPETPASIFKPYHLLKYLLEAVGKNTASAYLKKRNWLQWLYVTTDSNVVFTLFKINAGLTDDGVKHVDDVLEVIFSYIRLNLQELKHSASLEQLYWDSGNLSRMSIICETDPVSRFTKEFMYYTSENFGKVEYHANAVVRAIGSLNERKFNVTFVSCCDESFEYCGMLDKTYNATYIECAFPEKWTALWNNPKAFAGVSVPPVNPYIATDFRIVYELNHPVPKYPEKVYETDVSELWFRPGSKRLDAFGDCYFYFRSPILFNSPKNAIMLAVLERIVECREKQQMYMLGDKFFGFNPTLKRHDGGLAFKLHGPNHKQLLIMSDLTKSLKNLELNVTEEEFQNALQYERSDNKRKMCDLPNEYTEELLRSIIRIGYVAPHERLQLLESIQLSDFRNFCQQFFAQTKIRALIQGNFTVDEAKSIVQTVEANFGCKKVNDVDEMKMIGRTLPTGSHRLSIKSFNGEQKNTARLTYYQIGPNTLRQKALMKLSNMLISSTPLIDGMESLERCWRDSNWDDGMLGSSIVILSEENESRNASMDNFYTKYPELAVSYINNMSAETFQETVKYFLLARDGSGDYLREELDRNWQEILNGEYRFDRLQQEKQILSTTSHSDIVRFVTDFFAPTTRRLSIEYIGYKETCEISNYELVYAGNDSTESAIRIDDIDEFKAMLDGHTE